MAIEKVSPDKEKAKSLYKMAISTYSMAQTIDQKRYPSNLIKEYYDVIRELVDITLLLKGYKVHGEGAHEETLNLAYKQGTLTVTERLFSNELRKMRNRITYEGLFVDVDYITRKKNEITSLIEKLRKIAERDLFGNSDGGAEK